jgi:hypothetical protein
MEEGKYRIRPTIQEYVFIGLDSLFCYLITAPCVVMFWRGTWGLLDQYLLPDERDKSAWICLAIGTTGRVNINNHITWIKYIRSLA